MKRLRQITQRLPTPIRKGLSFLRRLSRSAYNRWRWLNTYLAGMPARGQVHVYYGHDHIPSEGEPIHGGMVKFQRMQDVFPNSPRRFNILYMGSSSLPADWLQLLEIALRKGARLVWNQDGVGYPAWHGQGWEKFNLPMEKLLHTAGYVFYQSQFCKLSADRFLGEPRGPWEILYNAVDTQRFVPADSDPDPQHLVLLSVGSIDAFYRFESAARTVANVTQFRQDARLIVAGRLAWNPDRKKVLQEAYRLIDELGMRNRIILRSPYLQVEAPLVFQRAHIFLHTQYNDACPTTVIEAMASGLPVVYSNSGGVPELVGDEAGIGVPAGLSWEQVFPPDPNALAKAVLRVAERRAQYAKAARQRAVEHFDLRSWTQRHREVFERLVSQ